MRLYDQDKANNYKANRAIFNPTDELVLNDGVLWDVRLNKSIHKFDKFNQYVSGVFHPIGLEIIINSEVVSLLYFLALFNLELSYLVWRLLLTLLPGHIAQSVTCLATDTSLTADPGVASSIPARSITFVEIYHEIISTFILLPFLNHSRRHVVSYKRKNVHKVLVNHLFRLAQEKVLLGEQTVLP